MEEIALQRDLPSRQESPGFEISARLAIEAALRDLISNKLLYQNISVTLDREALGKANLVVSEPDLNVLRKELMERPWRVNTHHQGDDPSTAQINRYAGSGTSPLGTPVNRMPIHYYAPPCQLLCRNCKQLTTFCALTGSREDGFGAPWPRFTERGTEQMLLLFYRCESCRQTSHGILIKREGLKLQLCGMAPRREQAVSVRFPKAVEQIYIDATNAVAEGDVSAGFYHLRTLLEHYLKDRLQIPIEAQERGEDLVAKHLGTLPDSLKSSLPSMGETYTKLSQYLHTRTGTVEEFQTESQRISDHIEGLRLLAKYSK